MQNPTATMAEAIPAEEVIVEAIPAEVMMEAIPEAVATLVEAIP